MRALIIEDEERSKALLINMFQNFCKDIEVVGHASSVGSAVSSIRSLIPDVVFLDIQIHGGTGFNVLDEVSDISFALVFITGYDNHAIKAIKYAALDYILKPIDLTELRSAIKKCRDGLNLRTIAIKNNQAKKIKVLGINGKIELLLTDKIVYIEAFGAYSNIYLADQQKVISSYPLKYHQEKLAAFKIFFKIHKSYIINLKKVLRYTKGRISTISLECGYELPIAARRKAAFNKLMKDQ